MKIRNIIAAICGIILVITMASGLPVFAAETQTINTAGQQLTFVPQDIDGDGKINQAEIDYAAALQAMAEWQAQYDALMAAQAAAAAQAQAQQAAAAQNSSDALPATASTNGTVNVAAGTSTAAAAVSLPWTGPKLTARAGTVIGPSGKELYYNLDMSPRITTAGKKGIAGNYWVREDGVKMYGDYIMVAASYDLHPYGTLVETSLGTGIVLDTGGFAQTQPEIIDIAVTW